MALLRRRGLPGYPHHVTERDDRRTHAFFKESGYALYRDLLGQGGKESELGDMAWEPMN